MKKILLLAAIAAPLAMSAQDTSDAPWQWLQYDMPAGTFFPVTNGQTQEALLPAGVPLTWTNTSYYINSLGTLSPWNEGTFTWGYKYYGVAQSADTYDLTTSADLVPLTALQTACSAPTMTPVDASGVKNDCYTGSIYGASAIADEYYTFNPAGATIAQSKLFSFDSGSDNLGTAWTTQAPDAYSNISVKGFAQRIEYPGVPYILTSIEMGTPGNGSSYVLSIYEAPADGSMTLPETPLHVFTATDGSGITAGKVVLSTYDGTPVSISTPIVVVVSQITGTFTAQTKMVTSAEDKPAVENEGAYALAEVENADGALETVLIPTTAQADGDNGIATAIAVKVGMYYPFLQPVSIVGSNEYVSATKPLTLNFNNSYNAASVRIASSAKAADVVMPEVPEWINLTVEDPTLDDVQAISPNATLDDAQYVIANIAVNSAVSNTAELTFGVTGAQTTITVNSTVPSGIDNVTNAEAEIVAREYYDLSGRRLNEAPVKGFYIEKTLRADGSSNAVSRVR